MACTSSPLPWTLIRPSQPHFNDVITATTAIVYAAPTGRSTSSQQPCRVGIIILILHIRQLNLMLNDLPKAHSKCLSQDYNLYLYHSKDCIFPNMHHLITWSMFPNLSGSSHYNSQPIPLKINWPRTNNMQAAGTGHMPSKLFPKNMEKNVLRTGSISEISLWPTKAPTLKEMMIFKGYRSLWTHLLSLPC